MYKACIFDLDGTLTDTLESLTYSVNKTLEELGHDSITHEQCRIFVGDGARRLIERALIATGDKDLSRIEEGMQIYGRVFQENCMYQVKPYLGILDLLTELKERGVKLAVVSNKPHRQTLKVVKSVFGEDTFDWIQGQCDEIPRKPDPAALFYVLEKFGADASESIYIGDSEVDMVTGKSAGALTLGVSWGFRSTELLEQNGADAVIEHADEVLHFLKS